MLKKRGHQFLVFVNNYISQLIIDYLIKFALLKKYLNFKNRHFMKVEEKVAQNDQKYRDLAPDSFAETVWVIDVQTLIVLYISQTTKKLRGFTYEETIGKHLNEIITPESYQTIANILSRAIQDFHQKINKSYKFEIEVFHNNGSTIWVELNSKIIKEDDGKLKIVGISRDISTRKATENDREKLIEKLNNVIIEKDRLAEEIKIFESLLPICSACRRIRHSDQSWWPLEKYIEDKAGSQFTHTICPDCSNIYYNKE